MNSEKAFEELASWKRNLGHELTEVLLGVKKGELEAVDCYLEIVKIFNLYEIKALDILDKVKNEHGKI